MSELPSVCSHPRNQSDQKYARFNMSLPDCLGVITIPNSWENGIGRSVHGESFWDGPVNATSKSAKAVTILWALTNHLTTWFATCLSIFCFLKITSFSHLFIWLKWRVNRMFLLLFLGSSFLMSVNLLMEDALNELLISTYCIYERNMISLLFRCK
nr:PREDICTED: putative taste receptor type 2 member 12 [Equus przewalskii]